MKFSGIVVQAIGVSVLVKIPKREPRFAAEGIEQDVLGDAGFVSFAVARRGDGQEPVIVVVVDSHAVVQVCL